MFHQPIVTAPTPQVFTPQASVPQKSTVDRVAEAFVPLISQSILPQIVDFCRTRGFNTTVEELASVLQVKTASAPAPVPVATVTPTITVGGARGDICKYKTKSGKECKSQAKPEFGNLLCETCAKKREGQTILKNAGIKTSTPAAAPLMPGIPPANPSPFGVSPMMPPIITQAAPPVAAATFNIFPMDAAKYGPNMQYETNHNIVLRGDVTHGETATILGIYDAANDRIVPLRPELVPQAERIGKIADSARPPAQFAPPSMAPAPVTTTMFTQPPMMQPPVGLVQPVTPPTLQPPTAFAAPSPVGLVQPVAPATLQPPVGLSAPSPAGLVQPVAPASFTAPSPAGLVQPVAPPMLQPPAGLVQPGAPPMLQPPAGLVQPALQPPAGLAQPATQAQTAPVQPVSPPILQPPTAVQPVAPPTLQPPVASPTPAASAIVAPPTLQAPTTPINLLP
jgi:hypothetical protein